MPSRLISIIFATVVVCAVPSRVWGAVLGEQLRLQVEAELANGQPAQALDALLVLESELSGDPEYDYLLGVAALAAGQNSLALHAFERVVLVEPSHAGAWLDLAIASMRLGDRETAAELVKHVEENFSPPAHLRGELAKIKQWLQQAPSRQLWRADAEIQFGHVSNANSGLGQSLIEITPAGGASFPVEVSRSQLSTPDNATQAKLAGIYMLPHGENAYSELVGVARARHYADQNDYDYVDTSVSWMYYQKVKDKSGVILQAGPALRYLRLNNQGVGYFATITAGARYETNQCQLGVRMELERRQYLPEGYYPATIPWLGASAECRWGGAGVMASMRYGVDKADANRPGGKTYRTEATVVMTQRLSEQWMLDAMLYLADYRDGQGYSVLLEHNASKYVHRVGERLGLTWRLPLQPAGHWAMRLDAERSRDISNLAIAEVEDKQVFLGLRYSFF